MPTPFYTIERKTRDSVEWEEWALPEIEDLPRILRQSRETYPEWSFRVRRSITEILEI